MQLGKYELLNRLAVGGMAEVFLARAAGPMGFEKTLVLKRILPHLAEDPAFVEMFLSEAKLAARLNHPNVVQIFEFGEAEGAYFLAMEYIDGPNLRTLIKQAHALQLPLPLPLCARLIASACEGLAFAHDFTDPATGESLGIIHRDISPDNILVSRQGAVKVVDFGIAKAGGQVHKTQTGIIKGKLAYMPPEQIRASPLDRRVDVYALGVVLYELLTGQRPFDVPSEAGLMQAVLFEPLVPAVERRPDLPQTLQHIVDRALAKDRDQRYPDCRAFQADLEDFILSTGKAVGPYQLAQFVAQTMPASGVAATAAKATGKRAPETTERASEPLSKTHAALSTPRPSERATSEPRRPAPESELRAPDTLPIGTPVTGMPRAADTVPMEPMHAPPLAPDTVPMERQQLPRASPTPTEDTGLRTADYVALLKPERKWLPLVLVAAVLAAGAGYFLASGSPEPTAPTPTARPSAPVAVTPPEIPPPDKTRPSASPATAAPPGAATAAEARAEQAPRAEPPGEAPPPPQPERPSPQAKSAPKTGTLHLIVQGWGTIWVDGKKMGEVPPLNKLELSAGRHELKIVNPAAPRPYRATVTIPAGGTLVHRVSFQAASE